MGTTNILDLNNRLEKLEKENVAQNNYNSLKNRPKINGNLLTGDKTGTQLGLANVQDIGNLSDLNTTDKSSCVGAINELAAVILGDGSGIHNALYRGKNLGTSFTAAQSTAIRDGSFKDLYIGDYWTINGTVYRIADFDYFLKSGDTECTAHHAVIVPDVSIDYQKMNDSNVTTGGYAGSAMHTTNLATAKAKINTDFGSTHVLSHRELLTEQANSGIPRTRGWYDSTVELMNESMVYGALHYAPASDGTNIPANDTIGCKQLNLFRHRPDMISNRQTYWLRDVVSLDCFAIVYEPGICQFHKAGDAIGVRPYFCIY